MDNLYQKGFKRFFEDVFLVDEIITRQNNMNRKLGHIMLTSDHKAFHKTLKYKGMTEALAMKVMTVHGIRGQTIMENVSKDEVALRWTCMAIKKKFGMKILDQMRLTREVTEWYWN